MHIKFSNNSNKHAIITAEGKETIIPPKCSACVNFLPNSKLTFSVKSSDSSKFYKNKYILNVETVYEYEGISENSVFYLSHEQEQIDWSVCFQRLIVSSNNQAPLCARFYRISDESKMKQIFHRKEKRRFFFWDHLVFSTEFVICLLLLGLVLTYFFGWKCAIIYFPVSYIFLLIFNWLSGKFAKVFLKKAFNIDDSKTEFYSFFENEFIAKYYSDLNREPFIGKIERDP